MARLVTSGGEIQDHPTTDINSPDGWSAGTAATVSDLTMPRSGRASILCESDGATTCYRAWSFTAPASGQSVLGRVYFRFNEYPTATIKIGALVTAADGALISGRLTPDGHVQLWNDTAGVQIGSDSVLVLVPDTSRFYRLQLRLTVAAGSADEAELLIKPDDYQASDESISATGLNISDTHSSRLRAGWIDAPGTPARMWLDDVAVNDSTGTKQNSWPSEGRVALSRVAFWTSGGSWVTCAGGTTIPDAYVRSLPPNGIADHSDASHTTLALAHQIRVAVDTAQSVIENMQAYAQAGVQMDLSFTTGTVSTSAAFGDTAAKTARAQSFKFPDSQVVDAVGVRMIKSLSGPTDTVIVELREDFGGLPSEAVLASGTVSPSVLTTSTASATVVKVKLSASVVLLADTPYWIVMRRSGALASANYTWLKNLSAIYNDGMTAVFDGTNWLQTGVNYSVNTHDFAVYTARGNYPPTVIAPIACHAQSATGAKGGTISATNPTSAAKSFNFGDNVGVAGPYPSNWRWVTGTPTYSPSLTPGALPTLTLTKNSGTGTTPVDVCFLALLVEYTLPPSGWARYQKTADSTFWWAKRIVTLTLFELAGGSTYEVVGGDWAIYPEPQVTEGGDFPSTLTSIDDATLQASYVLV